MVVFGGRADLWWLRLLAPGFRHCFVVLGGPAGWLQVDPLSNRTDIVPLDLAADADPAPLYRAEGFTVVRTRLAEPPRRPAPWRPFTCVEAVKRILGLHAPAVITPWQLFRYLQKIG